jgi:hypothetical protein
MMFSSTEAVPQLVSQTFPVEVWKVGDINLNVEMGTAAHTMLINAARAEREVAVETHLTRVPASRTSIKRGQS